MVFFLVPSTILVITTITSLTSTALKLTSQIDEERVDQESHMIDKTLPSHRMKIEWCLGTYKYGLRRQFYVYLHPWRENQSRELTELNPVTKSEPKLMVIEISSASEISNTTVSQSCLIEEGIE